MNRGSLRASRRSFFLSAEWKRKKNLPNLLYAFAEIRRKQPARLFILERDRNGITYFSSCGARTGTRWFVAWIFAGITAYIARSVVFARSSLWEGMPVALIEALALGIPVVSTYCPSGPAEVLHDGIYGDLVPMNDSAALTDAILFVFSGAKKPVADKWLAQFDSNTITERYLELMFR